MANIIPAGIDSDTGQFRVLVPDVDTIKTGTNDFVSSNYSGGDISIATSNDGSFVDVDAVNAILTFTVNDTGRFLVRFTFCCMAQGSSGTTLASRTSFRLTDSTDNSPPVVGGASLFGGGAFTNIIATPFTINRVFNFTTTGSKTVKLQKKNVLSTNVAIREVLANLNSEIAFFAVRVAD